MRSAPARTCCQLLVLITLMLAAIVRPSVYAQEPAPTPTPAAAPAVGEQPEERGSTNEVFTPPPTTTPTAGATTEAIPPTATATPVPYERAAAGVRPQGVQGQVALDVNVAEKVRAGEVLSYTFAYTNTSTTTRASGIILDATWTYFSSTTAGAMQYCELPTQSSLPCEPQSVTGPSVVKKLPPSGSSANWRYEIGDLNPGQSGAFVVQLRIRNSDYPKTNQEIYQPAGSGRLYLNNAFGTIISEDTANSLIIGPVLNVVKTAVTSGRIYAASTVSDPPPSDGTFKIVVGNATGQNDKPNGNLRVDAIRANGLLITDYFPIDSEFVSASPAPASIASDNLGKFVTWRFATLDPGQQQTITVTYKKLDLPNQCGTLYNSTLTATSDEYLIVGQRFNVGGDTNYAAIPVQVPLEISGFTYSPNPVYYGGVTDVTITVRNYWPKAISGMTLQHNIQTNAFFVQSSSNNPVPTEAPTGQNKGGTIKWTFDIPAGSIDAPAEKKFTFRLKGAFEVGSRGLSLLQAPSAVPSSCLQAYDKSIEFQERVVYSKSTDADPKTLLNDSFLVSRGQEFPYYIRIQNRGTTTASGISVTDLIPAETYANFTYVQGSGTIQVGNQTPTALQPTYVAPAGGNGGKLQWNGISVPGNTIVYLRYKLKVDGQDYYKYCNTATLSLGTEPVIRGDYRVCVKINPKVLVTKTIVNSNTTPQLTMANPGDEVRFQISLTNQESTTYKLGLADYLRDFTYVRQESAGPQPSIDSSGKILTWPVQDVAPGGSLSVVIVAKVPDICTNATYNNQALFSNATDLWTPLPEVIAAAQVRCSQIEYSKAADRSIVSLKDQINYTLQVRNGSGTAVNNITIEDYLPQGFEYLKLQTTSDIKTEPVKEAQPSGRTKLTWTLATLGPQTTTTVRFTARSGDVVGTYENWLRVPPGALCGNGGGCKVVDNVTYAAAAVTVQPLITMEPTISTTSCVLPGQIATYRLTIVNTNTHQYANTNVEVKLPFGLRFYRPIGGTPKPTVTMDATGASTLAWTNLTIAAKPDNTIATQMQLEIELQVGQVWGALDTVVTTTSPDGSIPRKDSAANPTVPVCPPSPAVAKDADIYTVTKAGDQVLYQITLANTTASPLTVSVQDQLPSNFGFVSSAAGRPAPTVSGNQLTWTGVTIPAATNGKAGILILQVTVRVNSITQGGVYPNTAVVSGSAVAFNTQYATVIVRSPARMFLPLSTK